jgi:peptidoglycan/xylan/chitin deacetylase (PgdA/CDA1 family)
MKSLNNAVVLMYHQIRPDNVSPDWTPSRLADPWYGISRKEFREQLTYLSDRGYPILSLSEFFETTYRVQHSVQMPAIIITFDDGYSTDLDEAAPLLAERGFPATFFLATSWIGKAGMLNPAGVRTLDAGPFTVGSHGATHRFLTQLGEQGLVSELRTSREKLKSVTGRFPAYLSVPGGRHDRTVREKAQELGFKGVFTSDVGVARNTEQFRIPRVVITRNTSLKTFARLLDPTSGPFRTEFVKGWVKRTVRKVLNT